MLKTLTTALLMAAIALPASAAETNYIDAFFEDWKGVIESLGQVGGQSEYADALERAKAIELDPDQRLKTIEGAIKVCEIMEKGRIGSGEMSRAITSDLGGRRALGNDRALRVRWIMAQAALKSSIYVICPQVARL